jgi:hypothetical protein
MLLVPKGRGICLGNVRVTASALNYDTVLDSNPRLGKESRLALDTARGFSSHGY